MGGTFLPGGIFGTKGVEEARAGFAFCATLVEGTRDAMKEPGAVPSGKGGGVVAGREVTDWNEALAVEEEEALCGFGVAEYAAAEEVDDEGRRRGRSS